MSIIEKNKSLPDSKCYQNQHSILGGKGIIFTTPSSGGNYYLRMWIAEEQHYFRKSLRTTLLADAKTLAENEVLDVLTKVKNGHKISGSSWKELCELFLELQQKRVDTNRITKGRLVTIRSQVLKHIIPFIGAQKRLSELSKFSFEDYGLHRREAGNNAQDVTIRNEYTTINAIIKFAYRNGYLPFEKANVEEIQIKGEVSRRDSLTPEEYKQLYVAMRKWVTESPLERERYERQLLRDFILLKANTFMRFGEIRQLKWKMFSTVSSIEEATDHMDKLVKFELPANICKNRRSRTVVALGWRYIERIQSYNKHQEGDDYIFADMKGNIFNKKKMYELWNDIIHYAKLDEKSIGKKLTFYSLRHFGITCRLYAKVPVFELSKLAGTSVTHIENHYGQIDMSRLIDFASRTFKTDANGIIIRD